MGLIFAFRLAARTAGLWAQTFLVLAGIAGGLVFLGLEGGVSGISVVFLGIFLFFLETFGSSPFDSPYHLPILYQGGLLYLLLVNALVRTAAPWFLPPMMAIVAAFAYVALRIRIPREEAVARTPETAAESTTQRGATGPQSAEPSVSREVLDLPPQ